MQLSLRPLQVEHPYDLVCRRDVLHALVITYPQKPREAQSISLAIPPTAGMIGVHLTRKYPSVGVAGSFQAIKYALFIYFQYLFRFPLPIHGAGP